VVEADPTPLVLALDGSASPSAEESSNLTDLLK